MWLNLMISLEAIECPRSVSILVNEFPYMVYLKKGFQFRSMALGHAELHTEELKYVALIGNNSLEAEEISSAEA